MYWARRKDAVFGPKRSDAAVALARASNRGKLKLGIDFKAAQGGQWRGLHILRVAPRSLAEQAGLLAGDSLVGFGGRALEPGESGASIRDALSSMPRGHAMLDMVVEREGKQVLCLLAI